MINESVVNGLWRQYFDGNYCRPVEDESAVEVIAESSCCEYCDGEPGVVAHDDEHEEVAHGDLDHVQKCMDGVNTNSGRENKTW
ncbi:hypothetical protein TNIN_356011 [Trichonephila inaurata madagascariensis]|uniref:Uncharacterized protein n=1 Tax=Trichonephila inaurata madagascariensis TaxID=2747483 RepID=A0A8X7CJB4_9ARAC|nr:hypothetical protein TNIN_356011 [Trichonephila inaurata madagascariensis]